MAKDKPLIITKELETISVYDFDLSLSEIIENLENWKERYSEYPTLYINVERNRYYNDDFDIHLVGEREETEEEKQERLRIRKEEKKKRLEDIAERKQKKEQKEREQLAKLKAKYE